MGAMCNVDKTTNNYDVDFEKVPNIMRSNKPEDR